MSYLQIFRKTKSDKQYDAVTVKKTLIELLFFIIFLVVISISTYLFFYHMTQLNNLLLIVTLDMSGTGMFYMSNMVKKLLIERPFAVDDDVDISFEDICLVDDYWLYVNHVFIKNIYGDMKKSSTGKSNVQNEKLTLLNENILIGPPRLKLKRVLNNSCVIDKLLQGNFHECFGTYDRSIEDVNPFGLKNGTA